MMNEFDSKWAKLSLLIRISTKCSVAKMPMSQHRQINYYLHTRLAKRHLVTTDKSELKKNDCACYMHVVFNSTVLASHAHVRNCSMILTTILSTSVLM